MDSNWKFDGRSTADQVLAGQDLTGLRVLVTGANTGIGYDSARALAAVGARVVLACRNQAKGEQAKTRIAAAHPGCAVEVRVLDLGSFASIRQFCADLPADAIDVLVCNAGSMSTTYLKTEDGFERTVGVCHIGHFLLTTLLLPRLLAAPTPRVVMVSSESHRAPATLDFQRFPLSADNYRAMTAYGQGKLCNALMAKELQRRYGDQGLTACFLHPGTLVTTEIGRESALVRLVMKLVSPFTKSTNQGAATTVLCATHPDRAALAGAYFSDCQPKRHSRECDNAEAAARLWQLSESWVA